MHNSHIECRDFRGLIDYIQNIVNGEVEDYDVDELSSYIKELYDNNELSSSEYDDLMQSIQDLCL